jgi:hypothetical protein
MPRLRSLVQGIYGRARSSHGPNVNKCRVRIEIMGLALIRNFKWRHGRGWCATGAAHARVDGTAVPASFKSQLSLATLNEMACPKFVRTCVKCGAVLRRRNVWAVGPFPCPVCHVQLAAPRSYGRIGFLVSFVLCGITFLFLGIRGDNLLFTLVIALYPILYFIANLLKYLIPPTIELYLPEGATLNLRDGPRP